jgi:protein gp37
VNSVSDLFHESVPDEWIDKIFAVMALTPQHTYQILTKRPERMRAYISGESTAERVRSQAFQLYSSGYNLGTPGAYTYWLHSGDGARSFTNYNCPFPLVNAWLGVSVENQQAADERIPILLDTPAAVRFLSCEPLLGLLDLSSYLSRLNWTITGGESGSNARPCELAWIESIVKQCRDAGVACWVKQLGTNCRGWSSSGKGDNPEHWPASIQVQQFPEA